MCLVALRGLMWWNMMLKRLLLSRDIEFMNGRNELNKSTLMLNPVLGAKARGPAHEVKAHI